jgi:hypothetical protein
VNRSAGEIVARRRLDRHGKQVFITSAELS